MENQFNSASNEKQFLSSAQPMFPPIPSFPPDSSPTAPPPSYPGPSQYPSTPGMLSIQYYPPPTQGMGYPPSYLPPQGGHPYYPQSGAVYPEPPSDTKYPVGHSQQQQQQQVVMTSNMPAGVTPVVVQNGRPVSMVGAFVLSIIAYICGGSICAGMAFAFASKSQFTQLSTIGCTVAD